MISVILAARNEERLIGRAIRSILAQTFRDFELIVVDNGSADRTVEIVSRLAATDARIRMVVEPNTGPHAARNRGAHAARGDLLAIQDADDVSHPERLERLAAYMARRPRTVVVGSWALCYSESGGLRDPFYYATSDRAIRAQLRTGPNPFVHTTVLFRKDAFLRVGGYPGGFSHSEDYALWSLLAPHGRFANLPLHLALYRHQERAPDSQFRVDERASTAELKRRLLGPATRIDAWVLRATYGSRRRRAFDRMAKDWSPELVRRLGLEDVFAARRPAPPIAIEAQSR